MKFIDLHCDTLLRLKHSGGSLRENGYHVDLDRLHSADCLAQFFAIFLPVERVDNPLAECLEMVDIFQCELEKNSDIATFAEGAADLAKNEENGKISAFLTIEDSGIIGGSPQILRVMHSLGVRLVTLTWNYKNSVGSPNTTPAFAAEGLTENGRDFVAEMERLGILVDVSHMSDAGFYDVTKICTRPFVASHSNARAVANCSRNLTDDMLKILAEKGGVIGINYCGGFIRPRGGDTFAPFGNEDCGLGDVVSHIRHIVNVAGEDVVALGGDFDGISTTPSGLNEVSKVPAIAEALCSAGFTESFIEKLFYKNAMRVISEVCG